VASVSAIGLENQEGRRRDKKAEYFGVVAFAQLLFLKKRM
jgi:hypothetical protein